MKKKAIIVLPIYYGNLPELEWSVNEQVKYFRKNLSDYDWKIVISLNGKKEEKVWAKIQELIKKYPEVTYYYTEKQGKGYGVIEALINFKTDINAFMDIDLTTELVSFRALIEGVDKGYDLVIGSRYHKNSKVKRSPIRYIVSKIYHIIFANMILGIKVSDAQCGFKAMSSRVVENVLNKVENKVWF